MGVSGLLLNQLLHRKARKGVGRCLLAMARSPISCYTTSAARERKDKMELRSIILNSLCKGGGAMVQAGRLELELCRMARRRASAASRERFRISSNRGLAQEGDRDGDPEARQGGSLQHGGLAGKYDHYPCP